MVKPAPMVASVMATSGAPYIRNIMEAERLMIPEAITALNVRFVYMAYTAAIMLSSSNNIKAKISGIAFLLAFILGKVISEGFISKFDTCKVSRSCQGMRTDGIGEENKKHQED